MPGAESLPLEYAILRVVPRVERGEFVNAGVIVFCLARKLLLCGIHLHEGKLKALCPDLDLKEIEEALAAISRVCKGDSDAGPIARLSARERFHWLVSPRSTIIQVSPVHSGLCVSPETALDELLERFVL